MCPTHQSFVSSPCTLLCVCRVHHGSSKPRHEAFCHGPPLPRSCLSTAWHFGVCAQALMHSANGEFSETPWTSFEVQALPKSVNEASLCYTQSIVASKSQFVWTDSLACPHRNSSSEGHMRSKNDWSLVKSSVVPSYSKAASSLRSNWRRLHWWLELWFLISQCHTHIVMIT